jgi:putative hydrolase of the HAD superfamily
MIKSICFDLDGVYFSGESFKRFKKNLPKKETSDEKINDVLYKSEEMAAFKTGTISEDDFWHYAKQELGITISNQDIYSCLQDSYEVNSEVKEFISEIRAKGYKSCACSNNFVTRIRELNNKFNFLQDFDFYVFSYEEHVTKPDKLIFERLIEKSGNKANEIAYSDDEPSRLTGAIDLGIEAFVYENFTQFRSKLIELGLTL